MSYGIGSGNTGGSSASPSGDRSATSGAAPTPQIIVLGIDTEPVDSQSLLPPSTDMESSAPPNLVASYAENPIIVGAHGPAGLSGEVRVNTGAVSNLSGPSLRSITHSPVRDSNIVSTDASVAVLPVLTGNQTTSSHVPRDAMGMQAAGIDQSSLRLQPKLTANPTPEESALGGGARKKSVLTDIPSSSQSAVKNSGSNRQEDGQTAANTRPPSSAPTVAPTVATAPAVTPAKSNKVARRSLENVVPAIGRNRLSVIADEPSQQPVERKSASNRQGETALVVLVSNRSASTNLRESLYSTLCAHVVVWNVIVIRDEIKIFDPGGAEVLYAICRVAV